MCDIFELFVVPLSQLPLLFVNVGRHGPAQPGLYRVGPPTDAHQDFGLFPQVFVDGKNQDGNQGEVDEPQPNKDGIVRSCNHMYVDRNGIW